MTTPNQSSSGLNPRAKGVLKSMRIGAVAEDLLIELLNTFGHVAEKNGDKSKRYEFDVSSTINGRKFLFEVKYDVMASRTGNIAIEFWNSKSNTPSGLSATKSDFWIQVLEEPHGRVVYITTVNNLKEFTKLEKPLKTIIAGGDKNSSMYIYEKERILTCFTEISADYFNAFL